MNCRARAALFKPTNIYKSALHLPFNLPGRIKSPNAYPTSDGGPFEDSIASADELDDLFFHFLPPQQNDGSGHIVYCNWIKFILNVVMEFFVHLDGLWFQRFLVIYTKRCSNLGDGGIYRCTSVSSVESKWALCASDSSKHS